MKSLFRKMLAACYFCKLVKNRKSVDTSWGMWQSRIKFAHCPPRHNEVWLFPLRRNYIQVRHNDIIACNLLLTERDASHLSWACASLETVFCLVCSEPLFASHRDFSSWELLTEINCKIHMILGQGSSRYSSRMKKTDTFKSKVNLRMKD